VANLTASPLFLPLTFRCGRTAPNRAWLAPLTNQQSHEDGSLSDEERHWLVRRAAGGFGVIETCAAFITADGKTFDGQLGIASEHHLPGLQVLAREIHECGALGLVQLHHGGVRASARLTGKQPISASRFEEPDENFETPRAVSDSEIELLIEQFVTAARRASLAGFAGVEIHAAHGYLLSQFLSRTMNVRSDAWGQSLEGRARFVRHVARAIRQQVPPPFMVGVRLSPEDRGHARGLDVDETVTVARWLDQDGVDFIHLSLWDSRTNLQKRPHEHALPIFRRELDPNLRLIAAGAIWTQADARHALDLGADAVAIGQAAILNPDWPRNCLDPDFTPVRGPLARSALAELDVSPRFSDYLARRFKHLVSD
jgi:2,4-dienoyl-CoA reductase-like NADH-dependent reductase (Old Yellow Enzyme family)